MSRDPQDFRPFPAFSTPICLIAAFARELMRIPIAGVFQEEKTESDLNAGRDTRQDVSFGMYARMQVYKCADVYAIWGVFMPRIKVRRIVRVSR